MIELLSINNSVITLWNFVNIIVKVYCTGNTDNIFGWMQAESNAIKVVQVGKCCEP